MSLFTYERIFVATKNNTFYDKGDIVITIPKIIFRGQKSFI